MPEIRPTSQARVRPRSVQNPSPQEITDFQDRLKEVTSRIEQATTKSNRHASPLLLAVSKSKPSSVIAAAVAAGVRHFGENYLQEALDKQAEIIAWHQAQSEEDRLFWHYIGNVQSNKTRPLAEHFDWVHTVCSEKQLRRLDAQRPEHLEPLNICLQVNLDHEPQKQGLTPAEAIELATKSLAFNRLKLRGLMCIPAQGKQAESFKSMAKIQSQLIDQLNRDGHANAETLGTLDTLSMGMSGDLEAAIAAGSTIVRIGTALFGERLKKD